MSTSGRMLLAIAAFLALVTAVYWFTSYEEAGTVLLLLAAGLAFVTGGYLVGVTRQGGARPPGDDPGHEEAGDDGAGGDPSAGGHSDDHYLPHASIWPLGVGAGSVVLANGLALGLWAVVPGTIILGASVLGYARQSRNRD